MHLGAVDETSVWRERDLHLGAAKSERNVLRILRIQVFGLFDVELALAVAGLGSDLEHGRDSAPGLLFSYDL